MKNTTEQPHSINNFLTEAERGNPVYITDVRRHFFSLPADDTLPVVLSLEEPGGDTGRTFMLKLPEPAGMTADEQAFVQSYLYAEIYNILSAHGGVKMRIFHDIGNVPLDTMIHNLDSSFGIGMERKNRRGYGRCINVIDRMLEALRPGEQLRFSFERHPLSQAPAIGAPDSPPGRPLDIFRLAPAGVEDRALCGMDIGGTDIKLVIASKGRIIGYKEYDWFPAAFTRSRQLADPVVLLVRLARCVLTLGQTGSEENPQFGRLGSLISAAMRREAGLPEIEGAVEAVEQAFGGAMLPFDAIGLCFPDVVVRNKIVGGEVYKTRGIRNNADIDYEEDFRQLTDLDTRLREYCRTGGVVRIVNDGPMAAFTAAVELAAAGLNGQVVNGVFAHTLGTELGTGWVDERGDIPDIPLEVYNFIIDLGSYPEKQFEPDDIRSINNFNTGLPGTLQKYPCQSGVFRLAAKYFPEKRPDLYRELFDKGFIVEASIDGCKGLYVPTEPRDMRKPLLEHLMALPDRENDETCRQIFREIGEHLAVTWFEVEHILHPKTKPRFQFGRLVKNPVCFRLLIEGARQRKPDIEFIVADGSLAHTALMRQLDAHIELTVAQFAQAVGAVHFANLAMNRE